MISAVPNSDGENSGELAQSISAVQATNPVHDEVKVGLRERICESQSLDSLLAKILPEREDHLGKVSKVKLSGLHPFAATTSSHVDAGLPFFGGFLFDSLGFW